MTTTARIAPERYTSLLHALKEDVVAPVAADQEVAPREADPLEAVLLEHPLRRTVLRQRPGFDAMQVGLVEREPHDVADRRGREPATLARLVDPVADVRALQRPADRVVHADRPGELV